MLNSPFEVEEAGIMMDSDVIVSTMRFYRLPFHSCENETALFWRANCKPVID